MAVKHKKYLSNDELKAALDHQRKLKRIYGKIKPVHLDDIVRDMYPQLYIDSAGYDSEEFGGVISLRREVTRRSGAKERF